jgi:long-chain acyl-CoA synthetase
VNLAKNRTLKNLLEQSVEKYANRPALGRVDEETITYKQLGEKAQTFSKVLYECGIMQGDRVAILSENDPNWGIAFFAITTMGAVAVPILPDFHTNEVHHILRHSEAKAIVISQKQFAKLENIKVADLQNIFLIEDFSLIPPETKQTRLQQVLQQGQLDYLKTKQKALQKIKLIPSEVREEDTASIIYTSGTTGHSKGVMLSHKNLVFDALATLKIQNVQSSDRLISVLPLSHSYECTIGFLIPMIKALPFII